MISTRLVVSVDVVPELPIEPVVAPAPDGSDDDDPVVEPAPCGNDELSCDIDTPVG
jgi:hypothetical protein